MTAKERARCNAKGIFSITQLSYGYRPRPRKRRPDAEGAKNCGRREALMVRDDHKLKALAIKKNQIHVVGAPSLTFDGTPTFLDVEGVPLHPHRLCVIEAVLRTQYAQREAVNAPQVCQGG